jgi:hypothetical protein
MAEMFADTRRYCARMTDPRDRLKEAPLYLAWKRQGKVWWNDDWIEAHGPIRQRIPGLDDHISFANYDLKLNGLPQIGTTAEGRPFVMCVPPPSKSELEQVFEDAIAHFRFQWEVDAFMKEQVYERLGVVAGILDVISYHGFEPASRTPGLDYLEQMVPRKPLQRVEYRELD